MKPTFMSPEHVAQANALLAASPEVQRQCAALARDYVVAYVLSGGPGGTTVHWHMACSCAGGVRLGLGPAPRADVVIRGAYSAMVAATQEARAGRVPQNTFALDGDPAVLAQVEGALAAARRVATIDVEFPQS